MTSGEMFQAPAFRRVVIFFLFWLGLTTLPSCEKIVMGGNATDARSVFEEAWTVIDERYALFSVKGIDWPAVHDNYAARLQNDVSDEGLFQLIGEMLATLKDGHVALIKGNDTSVYDGYYRLFRRNFNWRNIETNYLKGDYMSSGPIIYKVVDGVGYMYYGSFQAEATDAEVDAAINALAATKGLILDIRDNGGGDTENAHRLLGHFLKSPTVIQYEQYKQGKGHDDLRSPLPVTVKNASGAVYDKPVIILANRVCFSACNDFVSAMKALPGVRIFGDFTGGGGAIPREYVLGNGWRLRYSSSLTLDGDRRPIESGIAPSQRMDITQIEEDQGKDPIIDSAFLRLR